MQVAIRADSSVDIGTGHIMRCLTLADGLRERGATCRFVCREHKGNLIGLIEQQGYRCHVLPLEVEYEKFKMEDTSLTSGYAAWLGAGWAEDAHETVTMLGAEVVDLLIIDHYAIDLKWEVIARAICRRLIVIDDLADRVHDCDLLIDQNIGRNVNDYINLVDSDCRVLAGSRYVLLRPEFIKMRPYSIARRAKPKLKRMLITMGGADKDNVTGKILAALGSCHLPEDCLITVVMGALAPWLREVQSQARKLRWNSEVRMGVKNMANLMADSDLAIGAAGTTALERCYLGLPTLTAVLAHNQEKCADALSSAGAISLLDTGADLALNLQSQLAFCSQSEQMSLMQNACYGIIDGYGTGRVVELLTND